MFARVLLRSSVRVLAFGGTGDWLKFVAERVYYTDIFQSVPQDH